MPTSWLSALALGPLGISIRCTSFRLKASEYSRWCRSSPPCFMLATSRGSGEATTSLTQRACAWRRQVSGKPGWRAGESAGRRRRSSARDTVTPRRVCCGGSSQLRRKRVEKPKAERVRLARVIRAPSAPLAATTVLIEFEGARVAVGSGATAETLRTVFEALRKRSASVSTGRRKTRLLERA